MVKNFAKIMSMKRKIKTKLRLPSLSEKRLRQHAEGRADKEKRLRQEAEGRADKEKRLRQEAERRAAAEKCLRQEALQGRGSVWQKIKLRSLLNPLRCKKRAKRDVAQSETAALTPDDWLLDTCGPQDSECSADGGKIHDDSRRVFSIVMSEYQEQKKLPNALNDAEEVSKTFRRLNCKVESPAKNVSKDTLQGMFSEFLKSLDSKTYTVILHIAGHGFEQAGRLVLDLIDGSAVYLDELLFDLNDQLDKLVLQSNSKDDPVHSAGILVIWDACREALPIPIRSKGRKILRERQQAIIHSCMFGGCSEEAVADSENSPLILALSDLLGTNTPFTVFELAEHLNARVKAATKGRQSVELRSEATKLNNCYDWFVDLEKCNQLRAYDVTLKRLQAEKHDLKACARLISLWKVPCKSIESVEDVEDCLQSFQDSQQRLVSDMRAPRLNATVEALEQAAEAKRLREETEGRAAEAERSRQEAEGRAAKEQRLREEAEGRAAEAERSRQEALEERHSVQKKIEAARRERRTLCIGMIGVHVSVASVVFWSPCCSANNCQSCCGGWIVWSWFCPFFYVLFCLCLRESEQDCGL